MKTFEEWFDPDDHDLFNCPEESIKTARDYQAERMQQLEAENERIRSERAYYAELAERYYTEIHGTSDGFVCRAWPKQHVWE